MNINVKHLVITICQGRLTNYNKYNTLVGDTHDGVVYPCMWQDGVYGKLLYFSILLEPETAQKKS